MKKEEKIGLSEAIKRHYRTEPLKTQLPMAVADRIFGKKTFSAGDVSLYFLAALCGLAILALCVWALSQCSFSPLLMGAGISMAAFFWLSYKEMLIWLDV
ncbi:MAG: hypothetical protein J5I98_15440 [Phaeodactylibacter sp.]|nr:hypothetical protein [Phaeodactylibacter sp.]